MLITTLRNKAGTFIVVIITICIVAFLLQDALNSNSGVLSGRRNVIGSVDGQALAAKDFDTRLQSNIDAYKLNQNKSNVDEATLHSIRKQTFDEFVKEATAGKEYEALGLQLGQEEMQEMLFSPKNAHPQIVQSFTDPKTGQFSPAAVKDFLENIGESNENASGEEKIARWNNFMKFIKREKLDNKYKELVKKAVYVPKWMVDFDNNLTASVAAQYISVPFSSIADDKVNLTDSDLEAYLNKNQAKYKGEASAKIDFVEFSLSPSGADSAALFSSIAAIKDTLTKTTDDSVFVALNSDLPFRSTYFKKKDIKQSYGDTLFTLATGAVYGPILESGQYQLIKVVGRKMVADSVQARHILLKINGVKDSTRARKQADSIFVAIKDSASFGQLAKTYSADKSNNEIGGVLGYFQQEQTLPELNNFIFNANQGERKIITTQFGLHIIEILKSNKNGEGLQLAIVSKELSASASTQKDAYAKVSNFSSITNTKDEFVKNATAQGLLVKTSQDFGPNDLTIGGLGNSREVSRWVYDNDKNIVSKIIELEDKYVVCLIKEKRKEGLPNIEDVKEKLTQDCRNYKKSILINEKIAGAKAGDINALATAMSVTVASAEGVNYRSPQVGELSEPLLAAALSGCAQGKMTAPVAGSTGVYVGSATTITPANAVQDYAGPKGRMAQMERNKVEFGVYKALEKAAKVEDNMVSFF